MSCFCPNCDCRLVTVGDTDIGFEMFCISPDCHSQAMAKGVSGLTPAACYESLTAALRAEDAADMGKAGA